MINLSDIVPSKPKLIIFEGCDKVGKSTLFQAVRRATSYGPLAIDRFTGSNIVYDTLYKRGSVMGEYLGLETHMNNLFNCYLVVLHGEPEIIRQRILAQETGKDLKIALDNFEVINHLFLQYHKISRYTHKLLLDTTAFTEPVCVDMILDFLKEE